MFLNLFSLGVHESANCIEASFFVHVFLSFEEIRLVLFNYRIQNLLDPLADDILHGQIRLSRKSEEHIDSSELMSNFFIVEVGLVVLAKLQESLISFVMEV